MPTFDFKCSSCHLEFEEWQKISDPDVIACPSCGEQANKQCSLVPTKYGEFAYLSGDRAYCASRPSGKQFADNRTEAAQAGDGSSKTGMK